MQILHRPNYFALISKLLGRALGLRLLVVAVKDYNRHATGKQ
jgi:hypothetical protein